MILNKKVINYKIVDLIIIYNFDIKFDFIRDDMKKLWIFFTRYQLLGRVMLSSAPKKHAFLGTGEAITRL